MMDVDELSQESDYEESSAPYLLSNEVWMVPCTIDQKTHDFVPMVQPSSTSLEHRQERQAWMPWEDELLKSIILAQGSKHWTSIAKHLNEKGHNSVPIRHGKQCRERWYNHLDPNLRKGNWTREEDLFLLEKQMEMGNHWSEISKLLVGRNENSVKNRFKSLLRKAQKELPEGSDPIRWLIAEKCGQEMETIEGNSISIISPMLTSSSIESVQRLSMETGVLERGGHIANEPQMFAVDSVKRGLRKMEQAQDFVWQRRNGEATEMHDGPYSPSSFLA